MGYGGGVSCAAHAGYHLREADLLFEIVDPGSGQPVADGQMGEVVFTTLTRRTMPLIRYRTGNLASWITTPCPCGSVLRRLGWVQGRRAEAARLADGTAYLTYSALALAYRFSLPRARHRLAYAFPPALPPPPPPPPPPPRKCFTQAL